MPASPWRKICLLSVALQHALTGASALLTVLDKAYVATAINAIGVVAALTILVAVTRRRRTWLAAHAIIALVFLLAVAYHAALLTDRVFLPPVLERTARPLVLGSERFNGILIAIYILTAAAMVVGFVSAVVSKSTKREQKAQQEVASQKASSLETKAGHPERSAASQGAKPNATSASPVERRGQRSHADSRRSSGSLLSRVDPAQVQSPRFAAEVRASPPRNGSTDGSRMPVTAGSGIPDLRVRNLTQEQQAALNAVEASYLSPVVHQAYTTTRPAAEVQYQLPLDTNHVQNDYITPVIHKAESLTVVPLTQASPEGPERSQKHPGGLPRIGRRDSDVSTMVLARAQYVGPPTPVPPSLASVGPPYENGPPASGVPQYVRPAALGNVVSQPPPDSRADPWRLPGGQVTTAETAQHGALHYRSDSFGARADLGEDNVFASDDGDGLSDDGASTIMPMDSISQVGVRYAEDERLYSRFPYGDPGVYGYPPAVDAQGYPSQPVYYEPPPPNGMYYTEPPAPQHGYWPRQPGSRDYQPVPQPQNYPGVTQPQNYPAGSQPQNYPAGSQPQNYPAVSQQQNYSWPRPPLPDGSPPERYRVP